MKAVVLCSKSVLTATQTVLAFVSSLAVPVLPVTPAVIAEVSFFHALRHLCYGSVSFRVLQE